MPFGPPSRCMKITCMGSEKEPCVQGRERLWADPLVCLPPSCTPLFLAPYIFHMPVTQATCPCITLNTVVSPVICYGIEKKNVRSYMHSLSISLDTIFTCKLNALIPPPPLEFPIPSGGGGGKRWITIQRAYFTDS